MANTDYLRALAANTTFDKTKPEGDEDGDPTKAANKASEEAQAKADEAADTAERIQATQDAHKGREEAFNRSKTAFQRKPHTPSGKSAHAAAQMAHEDAADAYRKLGKKQSGHDLEGRSSATKMASEHDACAERHAFLAEGKADPAAMIQGREKSPTKNSWSDEAREAALAARKEGGRGETASTPEDHGIAQAYHHGASQFYAQRGEPAVAQAHQDAASAHAQAANGGHSSIAQKASRNANDMEHTARKRWSA